MRIIRFLLFPISILYGLITYFRNKLYDFGLFKVVKFDMPIISVGNLSMGGTGKTPHIEYLIRLLIKNNKLATLSRGYGRKTKGFFMADGLTDAHDIGDEPMQFHQKFPKVCVAVDANRVNGVKEIISSDSIVDLILLDDAFQHRRIKPGLQVLLTPFSDLYSDDWVFPTGTLREYRKGKSRANIIIVTKCPEQVSTETISEINIKLKTDINQQLFFSRIVYGSVVFGWDRILDFDDLLEYKILLVTGIANPKPLIEHLSINDISFKHVEYSDHHDFTTNDVLKIESSLASLGSGKKIILTTEKDYVRLSTTSIHNSNLMYLPISVEFINESKAKFDKIITNYVKENKRDS